MGVGGLRTLSSLHQASVVEVSPQDRAERNANDAQVDPHPRTPTAQKPWYDDFLQLGPSHRHRFR